MDSKTIWEILSSIPIGTVVSWLVVVCAIFSAFGAGVVKLYKIFNRYKKLKDENDNFHKLVEGHNEELKLIKDALGDIQKSLGEQKDVNLKQIRHSLVDACEQAISDNHITINKLKSLEELFEEYTDIFHGNGYVKTLMIKVRKLEVIGSPGDD